MANTDDKEPKKEAVNFVKYTGIAFQMLVIIGLFSFIGYKIDKQSGNSKLIFTAIFSLLGVIISLIAVVRSLSKNY